VTVDLDLSTDATPSPERTLQLAETFAELARVMNHATRHHEALKFPHEADRLIREIAMAASRLPQLLQQVSAWLNTEYEEGRVTVADAADPDAAFAVLSVSSRLESASQYAGLLSQALQRAASVTSTMTVAEDGV
jgi:hypothetical protein